MVDGNTLSFGLNLILSGNGVKRFENNMIDQGVTNDGRKSPESDFETRRQDMTTYTSGYYLRCVSILLRIVQNITHYVSGYYSGRVSL